jgi:hypothetical protein
MFGRILVSVNSPSPSVVGNRQASAGQLSLVETYSRAEKGFEHPVTLPAEQGKGGIDLAPSLPVGY